MTYYIIIFTKNLLLYAEYYETIFWHAWTRYGHLGGGGQGGRGYGGGWGGIGGGGAESGVEGAGSGGRGAGSGDRGGGESG